MPKIPIPRWKQIAPRTSDGGVIGYAWRTVGGYQIAAALIAILLSAMTLAPIDLERRIVDEVAGNGVFSNVLLFGAIYLSLQLLQSASKVALGVFQDWMTSVMVVNCRAELLDARAKATLKEPESGRTVGIIVAETDQLLQFVGTGFSDAAADFVLLVGFVTYMLVIEPNIALLGMAFLGPQLIIALLAQRRLNRLISIRVALLRDLADLVIDQEAEKKQALLKAISRNQITLSVIQHLLKAVRNLLIALPAIAVLIFGGWLVLQGQTTIGIVVAFVSGLLKMADPVRGLLDFYVNVEKARVQHNLTASWFEDQTNSATTLRRRKK